MTTKTVYSFDPNTRSFLRALTLDAGDLSPLDLAEGREVWLVPGNCTEVEPPADVPAGKYAAALRDGTGWEVIDVPVSVGVRAAEPASKRAMKPGEHAYSLHNAVQGYLDATARTQRFEDMAEAVSYIGSPVLKYALQAAALRDVRDNTWALVEPMVDAIASGEAVPVAFSDLVPTLPVYDGLAVEKALAEAAPDFVPEPVVEHVVHPLPPITQEVVDAANAQIALQANEKIVSAATTRERKSKKA